MAFFRRRRPKALRTSETYTDERMMDDHAASTAVFYAHSEHEPVDPAEQSENYDLTDDNDTPNWSEDEA